MRANSANPINYDDEYNKVISSILASKNHKQTMAAMYHSMGYIKDCIHSINNLNIKRYAETELRNNEKVYRECSLEKALDLTTLSFDINQQLTINSFLSYAEGLKISAPSVTDHFDLEAIENFLRSLDEMSDCLNDALNDRKKLQSGANIKQRSLKIHVKENEILQILCLIIYATRKLTSCAELLNSQYSIKDLSTTYLKLGLIGQAYNLVKKAKRLIKHASLPTNSSTLASVWLNQLTIDILIVIVHAYSYFDDYQLINHYLTKLLQAANESLVDEKAIRLKQPFIWHFSALGALKSKKLWMVEDFIQKQKSYLATNIDVPPKIKEQIEYNIKIISKNLADAYFSNKKYAKAIKHYQEVLFLTNVGNEAADNLVKAKMDETTKLLQIEKTTLDQLIVEKKAIVDEINSTSIEAGNFTLSYNAKNQLVLSSKDENYPINNAILQMFPELRLTRSDRTLHAAVTRLVHVNKDHLLSLIIALESDYSSFRLSKMRENNIAESLITNDQSSLPVKSATHIEQSKTKKTAKVKPQHKIINNSKSESSTLNQAVDLSVSADRLKALGLYEALNEKSSFLLSADEHYEVIGYIKKKSVSKDQYELFYNMAITGHIVKVGKHGWKIKINGDDRLFGFPEEIYKKNNKTIVTVCFAYPATHVNQYKFYKVSDSIMSLFNIKTTQLESNKDEMPQQVPKNKR